MGVAMGVWVGTGLESEDNEIGLKVWSHVDGTVSAENYLLELNVD